MNHPNRPVQPRTAEQIRGESVERRRARATARLNLGHTVEEVAEDLALPVGDVAALAERVQIMGWSA